MRPSGALPRTALTTASYRPGRGGTLASLLSVPALSSRPVSGRCGIGYREHGVLARRAPHVSSGGPGCSLRSRPRTGETASRPGCDDQVCGAHGRSYRRRYSSARTEGNRESYPIGSARCRGQADSGSLCRNGWDRSAGGEEGYGGSPRQDGGPAGSYAGGQAGMCLHPNHVRQGGLCHPRY